MSISGSGIGFGNQLQAKDGSEIDAALGRLEDAARSLSQARNKLNERLDSALRPQIPSGAACGSVSPVAPVRSNIGHRVHTVADQLYSEADSVQDMIARLAV